MMEVVLSCNAYISHACLYCTGHVFLFEENVVKKLVSHLDYLHQSTKKQ